MKILFIAYIDFKPTQVGASVRPQKMYRAFLDEGHEVKLLAGSQNRCDWPRRREAIREIMDWLDTHTPDLCYIESHVYPILLAEDCRLIRRLHRMGVPTGYFYRDFYKKFPKEFPRRKSPAGWCRDVLKDILQSRTDRLLRQADIVYVPCEECRELFPEYADVRPLPPAAENRLAHRSHGGNVSVYVGGVAEHYGGALMLETFHRLNEEGSYPLLLICRENEWEKLDSPFKTEPWLEVHHASSEQLIPYYERASIALALYPGAEYDDHAISVKLYEYIGFGLPVVVCGSKSMERVVGEGGFGKRAECTPESIAEAVKDVFAHRDVYAKKAEEALLRDGLWTHRAAQVVRELSEKRNKELKRAYSGNSFVVSHPGKPDQRLLFP